MSNTKRRTSAERIAFIIGWDLADMAECRYQPSKHRTAIYALGNDYFACPRSSTDLPKDGFNWKPYAESYGRTVYLSQVNQGV